MPSAYDVIVVGGGPAGAVAAYTLAKHGLEVALLEKESLPRYKACGGVVATHIEKILDFSIEPTIECHITKVLVTVRLGNPFVTQSRRPFVYSVMRSSFDNYLVEKAQNAGADISPNTPLLDLALHTDGYRLMTPKGALKSKYIIAADGANSTTRKLLHIPRFRCLSVAVEREVYGTRESLRDWKDTIALDFGYLSSGYGWVFPKSDNFSIGTGGTQSVAKELLPYYDKIVQYYQNRIGNSKAFTAAGHYLPMRVRDERIVYGRTLLVGDAAGLIDPLAGEGIYYAARSGQIAAETIIERMNLGENELLDYQRKIDLEIQPELQISKSLLFLLDLAPGFWVSRGMKSNHVFWKYFYRIFTGEKAYQDLPRRFGFIGQLFFYLLEKGLS